MSLACIEAEKLRLVVEIGRNVRLLRESRGVTLREFARRSHLSASFVSDVERGRRMPSPRFMQELNALLLDTPR